MKTFNKIVLLIVTMLLASVPAIAQQEPHVINIPITNPDEPIVLEIEMLSAYIEVTGEDRDDARFEVSVADSERRIVTPSGTQIVKSGAYSFEIEEDDNEISFEGDWRSNKVTVIARVPRRANLILATVNDGEIIVNNIEGNLELNNVNGPITARKISGSVIAEAVNAEINVHFDRIDEAQVTSFESINGDLRLGLPANSGVQVNLDAARGEIYSDFEVEVVPGAPKVKRQGEKGGSAFKIESVIVAEVNGGGPLVRMKSLYGDIYIEKAK